MQIDDGGGGCCHQRTFPAVKLALVLIVLLFPLYITVSETSDGSPLYGNYSGTGSEFDPYRGILNYNAYNIEGFSKDIDGCYVLVGTEFINEGFEIGGLPAGDEYTVTEGYGLELLGEEFNLVGVASKSGTVEITRTISSTTEVIATFYIMESSYPFTATSGSGTEDDPFSGVLTSVGGYISFYDYLPSEVWVYEGTTFNIALDGVTMTKYNITDGFGLEIDYSATGGYNLVGVVSSLGDCSLMIRDSVVARGAIDSITFHIVPSYPTLEFLSDPTDPLCATITYSKP